MFSGGIERDQWHEMGLKNTATSLRYGRKKTVTLYFVLL